MEGKLIIQDFEYFISIEKNVTLPALGISTLQPVKLIHTIPGKRNDAVLLMEKKPRMIKN